MKNNYDTSSQGVSLELSCFYDSNQSREDFKNDYERIGKHNSDMFFYTQGWEYSLENFYEVTDKELFIKEFTEDHYKPEEWEDLDSIVASYGLDDDYPGISKKYHSFSIRWYSQGDYAEIYYNPECLNEHITEKNLKEHASHTFYDAPIYCVLLIDWDEFYFYEYLDDAYSYDKDEIVQIAKDKIEHPKKEYIVQWLRDNLPEHPEYL